MSCKRFKDPIYGYVDIEKQLVKQIIDTPSFQRLRSIRQTSYAPLYHSSSHNRFSHSLGVYYLGKKAIHALHKTLCEELGTEKTQEIERTFLLACLLHDVGHAPFSHLGEKFYLTHEDKNKEFPSIQQSMIELVGDVQFASDLQTHYKGFKLAAAHEIMSVIVSLNVFGDNIPNGHKDFFARCITGYTYLNDNGNSLDILNCLISLLNSKVIDVDRLDYVIRDAYATGYQNASIDFNRLLGGLKIRKVGGIRTLVYHKGALSIIESVIFAHDSERKWIQSHHAIIYENYLIENAIRAIEERYAAGGHGDKLFCYESLTQEGSDFKEGKIRLLADEDILCAIKNLCDKEIADEIFCRGKRRRPVWKSEAEYRALTTLENQPGSESVLEKLFKWVSKRKLDGLGVLIINDELISSHEETLQKLKAAAEDPVLKGELADSIAENEVFLSIIKGLKSFVGEAEPFEFVLIQAKKFSSGFSKDELKKIKIEFYEDVEPFEIKKVSSVLDATSTDEAFFYLFYRSCGKVIDPVALVRHLQGE